MGFFTNLLRKGDLDFLHGESLSSKFSIILNTLNNYAFNGKGDITTTSDRSFNIYPKVTDSNQIIHFFYQMDILTIQWSFKYYQKEIVHKKDFSKVKNLSIFEQTKIANTMISEMENIVEKHKKDVMNF
ncbi:hypothetical protein [uncultured Algibacter sp.]|uniref:hypothetical protein n=1 Tax=uncultured Algibacter sp. TaxID=298659 RepID=UPI00262D977F|nr:hypothetical protein [uncultured Algibacter sp.]